MSEQEKVEERYDALIMRETEKAILVEPLNFNTEESIWIPKSQFQVESLEIRPWMLKKLGFEAPLHLQLPEGGWQAVEKRYPREDSGGNEAKQEEERDALKSPRTGATVIDDNPANETIKDRDGDEHIMTLDEKLTQIKIDAIEDGLDAIVQQKLQKHVKTLACIWRFIRADETFKKVTEIQRGYAVSAIYREHNREEHIELPPQDDDANVVKVYKIPYMGGGVNLDGNNNKEGPETVPETD